jgi:sugar lactone lactonase YvrE
VYVVDHGNGRVQVFTREGSFVRQIGASGTGEGQLSYPFGACFDAEDRLWVTDPMSHRVVRYQTDGRSAGLVGADLVELPRGIACAPDGLLHVADGARADIAVFSGNGALVHRYGGASAGLMSPRSLAISDEGVSFVADTTAAAIFAFAPDGRLRERIPLEREGIPSAPVHIALGPTGTLEVATIFGRPA